MIFALLLLISDLPGAVAGVERAVGPAVLDDPAQGERSVAPGKEWSRSYRGHRPTLGFELAFSPAALGGARIDDEELRAVTLQWEWQPRFAQRWGVFGVGPSLGLYPMLPRRAASATKTAFDVWSLGGQVRYQAKFTPRQWLVPVVGYSAEALRFRLQFPDGSDGRYDVNGWMLMHGPLVGGYLQLTGFEPGAANLLYLNEGVTRSYLVAEARFVRGSTSTELVDFVVDGRSLFFGLRVEY